MHSKVICPMAQYCLCECFHKQPHEWNDFCGDDCEAFEKCGACVVVQEQEAT